MMTLEVTVTRHGPESGYLRTHYTAHVVGTGVWADGNTPRDAVVAAAGRLGGAAARVAGCWEVHVSGTSEALHDKREIPRQLVGDGRGRGLV